MRAEAGSPWPRPLVIAHRGASGYLPEHTLPAYALAIGQGADVVEPDVVLTRDGVPICLHDVHLERVTDVATRFPSRAREDGRFHAMDFRLDEVRTLSATGGERHGLGGLRIPTLEEMVGLVRHLEARLGREIGIAPELKAPAAHRAADLDLEAAALGVLRAAGYEERPDRCIVQCFEPDALVRLREEHRTELFLLELIGGEEAPGAEELDAIAGRANAIGPPKAMAAAADGALVRAAHARDLAVIPYTFKDDLAETHRFFHDIGVDGLFSDFPDVALRARDEPR